MTENELKEIENEVNKLPRSWFFHDMAMAMVTEIKRLKEQPVSPEGKKEQLMGEFQKERASRKEGDFQSFSELNMDFDKETFKEWEKQR